MSDTHGLTVKEYVVVETVMDCDGSCCDPDSWFMSPTVIEWKGLPPQITETLERLSVAASPPPAGAHP